MENSGNIEKERTAEDMIYPYVDENLKKMEETEDIIERCTILREITAYIRGRTDSLTERLENDLERIRAE